MGGVFNQGPEGSQHSGVPVGFFAYASSPPSIPATIRAAIETINKSQSAQLESWEDLSVNGRYVISDICDAIDHSDFFCADLTGINANVMFELGYAIARNKRVWLIRDESFADAKKDFDQFRLLTTVGFSSYVNSTQIIKSFFADKPHLTLGETIFKDSIEPLLGARRGDECSLLYLKSRHDTDASVRITRVLEDSEIELVISDPMETEVRPLHWFAERIWMAVGVIAHFVAPSREGFKLHNARYALVSGLARGFDVNTIMLTELHDMLAPIDYRDAMMYYTTPPEAGRLTEEWLLPIAVEQKKTVDIQASYASALRLATELKDFHLQLGDFVAENESAGLREYFVETTISADLLNGMQGVFVGRKGTGKTANLIHAQDVLGDDVRNLVCLIKPVGYEVEALVRLFAAYKVQDYKGYVIESLWKFMIYTEIAHAAVKQMNQGALWELTEPDARALFDLLADEDRVFSGDFAVRLERVVKSLDLVPESQSGEHFRRGISEALHGGALAELRNCLERFLKGKRRVILLVDNLDKPWTKTADLAQLSDFLLGLLTATSRVAVELNEGERTGRDAKFNGVIFLRSDIFERVISAAREPDKLPYVRLRWDDPELLIRVIEERYIASHGPDSDPAAMWHRYFCPNVKGIPTREYLLSRILKRPRDVIFLVKAVVSFAVNRKHDRVEERDVLDGEKQYSQYALDSILVENGITIPQLEAVLFEFVGGPPVLKEQDVVDLIVRASIPRSKVLEVIAHLVKLSFLGIQIAEGEFGYSDEPRELKKLLVLGERFLQQRPGERRYQINPPFRSYLEIAEP